MKYTYANWLNRRAAEEAKAKSAEAPAEKVVSAAIEQFSVVEDVKPSVEDTVTVAAATEVEEVIADEKPAEEVTENTEATVEQAPAKEESVKAYKSNSYKRKTN